MAQYTIVTTRVREIALDYNYTTYGKDLFPTKELYLQDLVNHGALDVLVATRERDLAVSLDKSIDTIPEANLPKATQEIEEVIVSNGGTIIPPGPTDSTDPISSGGQPRRTLPTFGGAPSRDLQVRAADEADDGSGGSDGDGNIQIT